MRNLADIINDAMRLQRETKTLLEQGQIDPEEAAHLSANAEQVILFAQAAVEREEKV